MAHVVHISTVHAWNDIRVFYKQCCTLAENGYRVTLIGTIDARRTQHGVDIVPVRRSRNRLSRMVMGTLRALDAAWRQRADVYHLHAPEHIPLIPLLRVRGARVVFDAKEDLPDQVLDKEYLHPVARKSVSLFAKFLVWFSGRTCDHVLAATPKIARRFPENRTTIVQNYPIATESDTDIPYQERSLTVVYVGGMSELRGTRELITAAEHLPDEWSLTVAGTASPELLDELRKMPGWQRVEFRGQVSSEQTRMLVARARIGVVNFLPTRAHVDAMPNKMFEYMAAGIPVVASNFPLWHNIIERTGSGVCVDPADPAALAKAITTLIAAPSAAERMGKNGRRAVLEELNWNREKDHMLTVYRSLR
ncbi:glycosyltransferase family 4 protein [Saccharopolyspora hattusasensis]|uniref:glycosyltransferase family 4 protein n=1 Tax=Saccharopolyspora hattusasensis TaxID=1128679 RepID=UPI003D98114A